MESLTVKPGTREQGEDQGKAESPLWKKILFYKAVTRVVSLISVDSGYRAV